MSKPRGFAAMSPERRREISAKGGAAVPAEKRRFSDPDKARAAGLKGGTASHGGGRKPKGEAE